MFSALLTIVPSSLSLFGPLGIAIVVDMSTIVNVNHTEKVEAKGNEGNGKNLPIFTVPNKAPGTILFRHECVLFIDL